MKIWLNGHVMDARKAEISPLDRGLLYGDGLFETLRAYRGKPFLLGEHLDRLEGSAKALQLPLPKRVDLEGAVGELLDANGLLERDARVRITVTRGLGGQGPWPEEPGEPTALVTAQPVGLPPGVGEGAGMAAVTSAQRVLSGPKHKSTSFQSHVLAKGEARAAGAWEGLLLNERGEVAEGATSNVFALLDGQLVTPPAESGALPGITRAVVLRLAQPALSLAARERPLRPLELLEAREAFLTSSVAEVVPLVRLDGRAIGDGAPGPVTRSAREAYRAEVARVCGIGKSSRSDFVK